MDGEGQGCGGGEEGGMGTDWPAAAAAAIAAGVGGVEDVVDVVVI